jgi:hypothetical protein
MEQELNADAGTFLCHLTANQRQQLDALDAAYIELLSSDRAPASTDVEALAHAVVSFYDGLARARVSHETGA